MIRPRNTPQARNLPLLIMRRLKRRRRRLTSSRRQPLKFSLISRKRTKKMMKRLTLRFQQKKSLT